MTAKVPLSVLDVAPVADNITAAEALRNSIDLARRTEALGYLRYWVAEHHNMPGIASAATSVVIAHVASGTKTIRVGSGGIMLPNHAPLVIAEQFGTLASLYPRGIPIGKVTSVGQADTDLWKQVQVEPFADFDRVDAVLVLVKKDAGAP